MHGEVVAPVGIRRAAQGGGGMGIAARRAVVLGMTVLLGCAAVLTLMQSDQKPDELMAQQVGWMQKIYRQQHGMSANKMFMTAIQSGLLAASDGARYTAVQLASKPAVQAKVLLDIKAPAKTQRLQEVEPAPVPEPDAPPAEVQEGEAQEAADVPEEIAEAAADTKVPEGVLEGQEEIADDAVPETEEEGSSAEPVPETEPMEEEAQEGAAAPSDMQPDQSYLAPGGIPAGMKIVAAIQQPYAAKPPMNVVFQGSPFQVPVQSPGVGIIEQAVNMPPALFQGGGWSQETITGLPAPQKITVTVNKPEEPAAEKPMEEEGAAGEPAAQEPAAEEPAAQEATEEPTAEEETEEPAAEEAGAPEAPQEPAPEEPVAEEASEEPATEEPTVEEAAEEAAEEAGAGEALPDPVQEQTAAEKAAEEVQPTMQEPEMAMPTEIGATQPMMGVAQPYSMGVAVPTMGAARAPEMGQVMPVVRLGYAGVAASGSYCTFGQRQSPINIEFNIQQRPLPLLLWQVTSGAAAQLRAVPLAMNGVLSGRSLMLSGASAQMGMGGVGYALQRVYLHTASEHAIAGQKFDMEMQFLHSAILDGVEKFLVVSVFGRVSEESAPFLAQLAGSLPTDFTTAETIVSLNLADVASQVLGQTEMVRPTVTNAQSYYTYDGSFTTAPCTEGVAWIVLKNPLPVSARDLEVMSRYLAQPSRPLQPLKDRIILTPNTI